MTQTQTTSLTDWNCSRRSHGWKVRMSIEQHEHIRFKLSVAEDHHHDDDEDHGGEEGDHTVGPEGVPERPGGPEVRFNIEQIIPIVDSILEQDDKVSIKLD